MLSAEDAVRSDDAADKLHAIVKVVEGQIGESSICTSAGALVALRAARDELEETKFPSALLDLVERFLATEC